MTTRNLDEREFKATMAEKMRKVTDNPSGLDIFQYVEAVPAGDLQGHEVYERFVECVYRTSDDRFDHVLVMTKTKNVFLTVVVDLAGNAIYGHHLLDLNRLYGLTK